MVKRKYRLYGLVPYNISPIQQGIQFMHAAIEYANEFGESDSYYQWSRYDKTVIILNGGTTNTNSDFQGTLNSHLTTLLQNNVKVSKFYEPDLGDQMTAIVFLVDDRVWDKVTWPDYDGGDAIEVKLGGRSLDRQYYDWENQFGSDANDVVFMRNFLKQFRFA
jgi:hypothetical protein